MISFVRKIFPIVALIAAVIAFYPKAVFNNETFVASGQVRSDLYTFNYPIKQLLHISLTEHHSFPFWNDLMGSGYPVYAEGQVGALYPFHVLFFSLPFETFKVFNLNLLFHYALGGILTYIFLQNIAKLNKFSALLGSIICMFSGWMISFLQHSNTVSVALYFPLNLILIEKLFTVSYEHSKRRYYSSLVLWAGLLSIALFLQVTLGHVESAFHNFLFAGCYFLVRLNLNRVMRVNIISKLTAVVTAGIIALLLSAPQLLATIELTKISTREAAITDEASTEIDWPLHSLKLFVKPDSYPLYIDIFPRINGKVIDYAMVYGYIGILPLVLILLSFSIAITKKQQEVLSLRPMYISILLCAGITILYLVGGNTQFFTIVRNTVPGLSYFRYPIKALYVLQFYMAVCAAYGLQILTIWLKTKQLPGKGLVISKVILVLIIMLCYLDLRINNQWIQPTLPASYWLEKPPAVKYLNSLDTDCHCDDPQKIKFQNWRVRANQVEIKGADDILNWKIQKDLLNTPHVNMNVVQNIMLNEAYSGLPLDRITRINSVPNSLDTDTEEIVLPPKRKKVLNLEGVKYVVSDIRFRDPDLKLIKEFQYAQPYKHLLYLGSTTSKDYIETDRAYLYQNQEYIPRIQLIPEKNAVKMKAENKKADNIFEALLSDQFDPKNSVIIETDKGDEIFRPIENKAQNTATYKVVGYSQEHLKVEVRSDVNMYMVISDNYYPGWKAMLDNQEVQIEKANYAFRAVAIPAGTYVLTMYYSPTYMRSGLILFSVGASLLIGSFVTSLSLKRQSSPNTDIINK